MNVPHLVLWEKQQKFQMKTQLHHQFNIWINKKI